MVTTGLSGIEAVDIFRLLNQEGPYILLLWNQVPNTRIRMVVAECSRSLRTEH